MSLKAVTDAGVENALVAVAYFHKSAELLTESCANGGNVRINMGQTSIHFRLFAVCEFTDTAEINDSYAKSKVSIELE